MLVLVRSQYLTSYKWRELGYSGRFLSLFAEVVLSLSGVTFVVFVSFSLFRFY